jgi:hypothetical protein
MTCAKKCDYCKRLEGGWSGRRIHKLELHGKPGVCVPSTALYHKLAEAQPLKIQIDLCESCYDPGSKWAALLFENLKEKGKKK